MNFNIEKNQITGHVSFRGGYTERELASLELSDFDRALINDVAGDDAASTADYLLVLEMIFRRLAEQQVSPSTLAQESNAQSEAEGIGARWSALLGDADGEMR